MLESGKSKLREMHERVPEAKKMSEIKMMRRYMCNAFVRMSIKCYL